MSQLVAFIVGVIAALALMFGALGGVFFRLLSGEDDFDPDDDPNDAFPWTPPREA